MKLIGVGLNFRTTPVAYREQISFRPAEVPGVLRRLRRARPDTELLLVSTCNRTELYAAGEAPGTADALLEQLFTPERGLPTSITEHAYRYSDEEAIEHLMVVASSLDSMVVGETEILGQVKQAYTAAVEAGTVGKFMQPLLQQVFRVAKLVRTETDISAGRVSVGSIAIDLAEHIFDHLEAKSVTVVGAGEVSEQTVKTLAERGVRDIMVLNRSLEKAQALAAPYGGAAVPFERLDDYLPRADIVISSTGAPHCVIRREPVRRAMTGRHGQPLFIIDLAVPRDVEESVGELDNVYLYNIDDLQRVADENLKRREAATEQARAIIREQVASVAGCTCRRGSLGELMRRFDARTEAIKEAELTRIFDKRKVASRDEKCQRCRREIQIMLHRSLNKMASAPKRALNQAARNGSWDDYSRVAADLLNIGEDDGDEQE